MNCEECLVEMETMSTNDIGGSAVALHSANCRECARVLQAITVADRLMIQERDETYATTPSDQVARRAVVIGQRRNIFGGVSLVFAALVAFSVWFSIEVIERPSSSEAFVYATEGGDRFETESFEIRCLSADNITPLLGPYTQARGSKITRTLPPLRVITVRTLASDMQKVRDVLKRFDVPANGRCDLTAPEPAPRTDVRPSDVAPTPKASAASPPP